MIIIIEFIPTWEVFAFIQRKRPSGFVGVVFECQRVRGFVEHRIRFCLLGKCMATTNGQTHQDCK